MIRDTGKFIKGLVLFVLFFVILWVMFQPWFPNENALEAADRLFNSISKDSAYYIPDVIKKSEKFKGNSFTVKMKLKSEDMAKQGQKILTAAGAKADGSGAELKVEGDLGKVLGAALTDADALFHNRDAELQGKYGVPGKVAVLTWWNLLKETINDLDKQKRFADSKFVAEVMKKGVEPGYNYYGIKPQPASSRVGILTFSLVFYVIYTLWWGYSILFLFEGFGLQLKAGKKKEV
jgi:hypothetical protein